MLPSGGQKCQCRHWFSTWITGVNCGKVGYNIFQTDADPMWLSGDLGLYQTAHSLDRLFFILEWGPSYGHPLSFSYPAWQCTYLNVLLALARWLPVLNVFYYKAEDPVFFPEALYDFDFQQVYENVCLKPRVKEYNKNNSLYWTLTCARTYVKHMCYYIKYNNPVT